MKRTFALIMALLIALLLIPAAALAEGETELTLTAGEKLTLDLSAYANSGTAAFSTSNKKIASVSKRGVVTGVKQGEAVITAFFKATGETAVFNVTVNPKPYVKLNMKKATLYFGSTEKSTLILEAECYPETLEQELIWTSTRPSVAMVLDNGAVIANNTGSATITAATPDGKYKASCSVSVKLVKVAKYAGSAVLYGHYIGQTIDTDALMSYEGMYAEKNKKNTEYSILFSEGQIEGFVMWTVNSKKKLVSYVECVWSPNFNAVNSEFNKFCNDAYAACGMPQATYVSFSGLGNGGTAQFAEAALAGNADERLIRDCGMFIDYEWSYKKGVIDAIIWCDDSDGMYMSALELH